LVVGREPKALSTIISPLEYGPIQSHCPYNLLLEEELKKAMARNRQLQHHVKHNTAPYPIRKEVIQQLIQR
jgi:hypothetical protein